MELRLSGCLHKGYSAFKEKDFYRRLTKALSVSGLGSERCVSGWLQPGVERGPAERARTCSVTHRAGVNLDTEAASSSGRSPTLSSAFIDIFCY